MIVNLNKDLSWSVIPTRSFCCYFLQNRYYIYMQTIICYFIVLVIVFVYSNKGRSSYLFQRILQTPIFTTGAVMITSYRHVNFFLFQWCECTYTAKNYYSECEKTRTIIFLHLYVVLVTSFLESYYMSKVEYIYFQM